MNRKRLVIRLISLLLVLLLAVAAVSCGGGGGGGGTPADTGLTSGNWDTMVWDNNSWQ